MFLTFTEKVTLEHLYFHTVSLTLTQCTRVATRRYSMLRWGRLFKLFHCCLCTYIHKKTLSACFKVWHVMLYMNSGWRSISGSNTESASPEQNAFRLSSATAGSRLLRWSIERCRTNSLWFSGAWAAWSPFVHFISRRPDVNQEQP